MIRPRIIPVLQIYDGKLVKTTRFKNPSYVGDPINAVRIFNEKRVDEMVIVDITPKRHDQGPDLTLLKHIFSECDMPVSYGGGIFDPDIASEVFHLGCEKIIVNSAFYEHFDSVCQIVENYGAQAVSISLDYGYSWLKKPIFYTNSAKEIAKHSLSDVVQKLKKSGAGEVILHCVDRDGKGGGYDLELLKKIKRDISVPIVLLGGADSQTCSSEAIHHGAHSVAAGSRFIYHGEHKAVLIKYERF